MYNQPWVRKTPNLKLARGMIQLIAVDVVRVHVKLVGVRR
jgi:hypothetical protein